MKRNGIAILTVCIAFFCVAIGAGIGAVKPARAEAGEINCILDSLDESTNVRGAYFVDHSNFVEGTGCLYSRAQTVNMTVQFHSLDHSLLPEESKAYLEFYVWVEDKSIMQNCVIEINSSMVDDLNEKTTDISSRLTNGWNHVSLRISSLAGNGGAFDLKKLRAFRIYSSATSANRKVALRIDRLMITDTPHSVDKSSIVAKDESWTPIGTTECNDYYNG